MKFEKYFSHSRIREWRPLYINYALLKKMISPFSEIITLKAINMKEENQILRIQRRRVLSKIELPQELEIKLRWLENRFTDFLQTEMSKTDQFYKLHIQQIDIKLKTLKYNLILLFEHQLRKNQSIDDTKATQNNTYVLKLSNKALYNECLLLESFCILNRQAFKKLSNQYSEKAYFTENFTRNCLKITEFQRDIETYNQCFKLNQLQEEVEHLYITYFSRQNPKKGVSQLKMDSKQRIFNSRNAFGIGFFIGLVIFITSDIILHIVEININFSKKSLYSPMISCLCMFLLYSWMTTLNIYIWKKAFINYKNTLNFDFHNSTVLQICRRLSFFTFCFLFILCLSLDKEIEEDALHQAEPQYYYNPILKFIFFPPGLGPLIVWSIIICYLIIPTQVKINGRGRRYFWRQILFILISPFQFQKFATTWVTEQFSSLIIPFRSFVYTICYYTQYFSDSGNESICQQKENLIAGYIVAFIPFFFLFIQNIKFFLTQGQMKKKSNLLIISKHLFTMIIVTLGYLGASSQNYFILWVILGIILSLYSYYLDLCIDWGLLQNDTKIRFLRRQLAFEEKKIYYIIMIMELFLRFNWLLTISPNIFNIIDQGLLINILVIFEIFRRFIWNILRFENYDIENNFDFRQVQDMKFPYESKLNNDTYRISYQFEQRISNMQNNQIGTEEYSPFRDNYEDQIDQLTQLEENLIEQIDPNPGFFENLGNYDTNIKKIYQGYREQCKILECEVHDIIRYIQGLTVQKNNGMISLKEQLLDKLQ